MDDPAHDPFSSGQSPGPAIAAWCFQCGLAYEPDVAECVECAVPTVGHAAGSADALAATGGEQVAYEMHGWNGLARAEVERRLHAARLAHTWQGPTLLVAEADEATVDSIIDEVDETISTSLSEGVEAEGGQMGFDLGTRSEDLHASVTAQLQELGIEHELLANGFLLVDSEFEDQVGDLIEEKQEELRATASFGPGVEGVNAHEVVESMFLAADTLRRNTRDGRAQRKILEAASLAHDLKLPFGYEAPMWRGVLDQVAVLAALIEDVADDGMVEEEAGALRDMLHPYV